MPTCQNCLDDVTRATSMPLVVKSDTPWDFTLGPVSRMYLGCLQYLRLRSIRNLIPIVKPFWQLSKFNRQSLEEIVVESHVLLSINPMLRRRAWPFITRGGTP